VELTIDPGHSSLLLPRLDGPSPAPAPSLTASTEQVSEASDVTWTVERDVLRRRTTCRVDHGSSYDEDGVHCSERYRGSVWVDTMTWEQHLDASAGYTLVWPEVTVSSDVRMTVAATERSWEVDLALDCRAGEELVASRRWQRSIPRDLG
jgi:hypothetical protein